MPNKGRVARSDISATSGCIVIRLCGTVFLRATDGFSMYDNGSCKLFDCFNLHDIYRPTLLNNDRVIR